MTFITSALVKPSELVRINSTGNTEPLITASLILILNPCNSNSSPINILSILKNELRHHNLEVNIKSGFVLCGGGAQALGCEELVRKFFTRRVKMGVVKRNRISGRETILLDYRYAGSIGLLLHQEDLSQEDFIMSRGSNGVIDKIKEAITGNF